MKLTLEQDMRRASLRCLASRHNAAWKLHASHGKNGSSATPEQQAAIAAEVGGEFTNEQRAELETLDFLADEPAAVFQYVKLDAQGQPDSVTGWTGQKIGRVSYFSRVYQSPGFGRNSERQNIRVCAINGRTYSGVYYKSAGDYCRLKLCKSA